MALSTILIHNAPLLPSRPHYGNTIRNEIQIFGGPIPREMGDRDGPPDNGLSVNGAGRKELQELQEFRSCRMDLSNSGRPRMVAGDKVQVTQEAPAQEGEALPEPELPASNSPATSPF
jgi:hypothetical protein